MKIVYANEPYFVGYKDKDHNDETRLWAVATFYGLEDACNYARKLSENAGASAYFVYRKEQYIFGYEGGFQI